MSLLTLSKQNSLAIKAKNDFLQAFNQKKFSTDWLITPSREVALPTPALSCNFIFEESYEFLLNCEHLPFLSLMEEWAKPWHWRDLPPSLSHALLEEVLNHFSTQLPPSLHFNGFSSNFTLENNKLETFTCQVSKENLSYRIDIHTKQGFPFDKLSRALNLTRAQQAPYPNSLFIELPIKLSSRPIPASALQTLHKGDIILIT